MASSQVRVAVLGAGAVGKSAVTIKFVRKFFVDEYDPTIEDSYQKSILVDGKTYQLDILDTAGQEEYSAMRESYMQDGEGFMLVYSSNSRDSFEALVEFADQISRVRDLEVNEIPIIVVHNKCDLPKDHWEVSEHAGATFAARIGASFVMTSALLGTNVDAAFQKLVQNVLHKRASAAIDEAANAKLAKRRAAACVVL